jgi:hypothetical protein
MRTSILILLIIAATMAKSQGNSKSTFDFWVGTWEASWSGSAKGINTIGKVLRTKVIEENFAANDKSFAGKSWTVYDTTAKLWRQTWVDDAGAYLLFTGGQEGDKVVLNMSCKTVKNGKTVAMRMVFYNIKKESFDWDWQSSEDEKNWKSAWLINYKRKE